MRTTLATVLAFASGLAAQVVATAPSGLANSLSASSAGDPFSALPYQRFQYCHPSLIGSNLPPLTAVNFRRDKSFVRPQNTARSLSVEVVMGHGAIGRFDEQFDANYTVDRTVAVATRSVALPNLFYAVNGANQPEPWSIHIPLDQPFTYQPAHALILEFTTTQGNGDYALQSSDSAGGALMNLLTGTTNDYGCRATGRAADMQLNTTQWTHVQNGMMRLQAELNWAPANAPAWLNIATNDANLTVPGLCAAVHALPTIQLPLGTADAAGRIPTQTWRLPYLAALRTTTLFMQAIAFDAGQSGLPLALSNDQQCRWPTAPTQAPSAAIAVSQQPGAARASALAFGGVAICGLE